MSGSITMNYYKTIYQIVGTYIRPPLGECGFLLAPPFLCISTHKSPPMGGGAVAPLSPPLISTSLPNRV